MSDWPLSPTALQSSGTYPASHGDLVLVGATGILQISLPSSTNAPDQSLIGIKTIANTPAAVGGLLYPVTVMPSPAT
jgi:hypothetical protein